MEKQEFITSCRHLCDAKDFEENAKVLELSYILENKQNFKSLLMLGFSIQKASLALQKCISIANTTPLTTNEVIQLIPRMNEIVSMFKE